MTTPTIAPNPTYAPPKVPERTRHPDRTRDRDRLVHIVDDRDKVREAMHYGFPVKALCGKRWVPRRWKPRGGLRCQVCADIARQRYPVGPGE